ncbi:MAG: hypothetical protein WD534_18200 [Phycisphaeraceae bacterium]
MPSDLSTVRHLHAWAQGRPTFIVIVAQQLAVSAPIIIELVELIRSGAAARKLHGQVDAPDWRGLYREPKRMRRVVRGTFWPDGTPAVMPQLGRFLELRQPHAAARALEKLDNAPADAMEAVQKYMHELLERMYFEHLTAMAAMAEEIDPLLDVDMDRAMALPEVQFFVLALLPALLEYGESPTRLYAKARRGDRVALDKLLRLDKTVLGDVRYVGLPERRS